jgi:hypothetical protein
MTTRILIKFFFSFILLSYLSCKQDNQETRQIEGDLYFDWLGIGSFYNEPDSIIERVKLYADTVDSKMLDPSDLKILKMYETLQKADLLYQPFIDLKLDNYSIIKVYFTNDDYEKIKINKRKDLLNAKMKIRIRMEVKDLGYGMVLDKKLLSLQKVPGQTSQINPKMKIEDYH